jgi:probable rRNA maturation factor
MIVVEVLGHRALAQPAPPPGEVRRLSAAAANARDVHSGHLAVHFVDEHRIRALNAQHRGRDAPTDVLSFPIDGVAPQEGDPGASGPDPDAPGPPLELGDIFICAAHTEDLRAAIVHGVLHLVGMDHETDNGEMLALQDRLLGEHGHHA